MITEMIQGTIDQVSAGYELGFGRLALQALPGEQAEQLSVTSPVFPQGFQKSGWLRPGEQLVAPPSPSSPHYTCASITIPSSVSA